MNASVAQAGDRPGDLWSRSRRAFWIKGNSPCAAAPVELRIDCDRDCLLALVAQDGFTCRNRRTCFYTAVRGGDEGELMAPMERSPTLRRISSGVVPSARCLAKARASSRLASLPVIADQSDDGDKVGTGRAKRVQQDHLNWCGSNRSSPRITCVIR